MRSLREDGKTGSLSNYIWSLKLLENRVEYLLLIVWNICYAILFSAHIFHPQSITETLEKGVTYFQS